MWTFLAIVGIAAAYIAISLVVGFIFAYFEAYSNERSEDDL